MGMDYHLYLLPLIILRLIGDNTMSKDHDDNEMPHVEMPVFESPPKDYAEFTQQTNAMAHYFGELKGIKRGYESGLKRGEMKGFVLGQLQGYQDANKDHDAAISDGTRKGSSECAKQLRNRRKD